MSELGFQGLRKLIKNALKGKSKGWTIEKQSGKVKLVNRWKESGEYKKQTCILDIPWEESRSPEILMAITRIQEMLLSNKSLLLAEAAQRYNASLDATDSAVISQSKSWKDIAQCFMNQENIKSQSNSSIVEKERRVDRFVSVLESDPKPRNGHTLMNRWALLYFTKMEAGGDGRNRDLKFCKRLLLYGIEEQGAHKRWEPLPDKKIKELIGISPRTARQKLRSPLLPEDLIWLLDSYKEDELHRERLAVGLVALFGLRPSELATMQVSKDGNELKIGAVKRNEKTMGKNIDARKVMAIDCKGNVGLGRKLLQQYASGLIKLPDPILREIKKSKETGSYKYVGHEFSKILRDYQPWQSLVSKYESKDEWLVPYSLRHGWAWRCHKPEGNILPIHERDAAELMGHTRDVHQDHYGSWTSAEYIKVAVDRYQKELAELG
jgi:integrase